MEDKLLKPKEAALQFNVSPKTIHNRMASGALPYCEIMGVKRVRQSVVNRIIRESEHGKYERRVER